MLATIAACWATCSLTTLAIMWMSDELVGKDRLWVHTLFVLGGPVSIAGGLILNTVYLLRVRHEFRKEARVTVVKLSDTYPETLE